MDITPPYEADKVWRAPVLAVEAGLRWLAVPMGFNHRLIGVRDDPYDATPLFGWCYHTASALLMGAQVFDPVVQDEPLGWHKRAGDVRLAPQRHADPSYNRPRCQHGTWLHETVCRSDDFCTEFHYRRTPS